MSKELETYAAKNIHQRFAYAAQLAKAGSLVPSGLCTNGVPDAGKIYLVTEIGAMLGIHPLAAMQGIDVIEGKAAISPGLMSARVRHAGHKLRVRTEGSVETGDFVAIATIVRADDPDFTYETRWTIERAVRAERIEHYAMNPQGRWIITTKNKNWRTYPEAMCKARAIGEVCREAVEDVLTGAHYTPEELGAITNEDGESVEYVPTRDWKAEIDATDDKAVFAVLLKQLRESDDWNDKLEDYLVAKASLTTKDSRLQQPDEAEQKANATAREADENEVTYDSDGNPTETATPAPESEQEAEAAQPADDEAPSPEIAAEQSDDERAATGEMTPEEYEAYSAEQFAKEQAQK